MTEMEMHRKINTEENQKIEVTKKVIGHLQQVNFYFI